jgi:hypothetical protein
MSSSVTPGLPNHFWLALFLAGRRACVLGAGDAGSKSVHQIDHPRRRCTPDRRDLFAGFFLFEQVNEGVLVPMKSPDFLVGSDKGEKFYLQAVMPTGRMFGLRSMTSYEASRISRLSIARHAHESDASNLSFRVEAEQKM